MKNLKFNFKSIVLGKARWLVTLFAILTLGVGQMWGWTPFYMYGNYQSSWDAKDKVNLDGTIANGKYFLPVYHDGSTKYFRLYRDSKDYGPSSSKELPSSGEQGGENGTANAWYISSSEKKVICICIDQKGDGRDQYPWVWARDAEVYLKHTWSSSTWEYSAKMTANTTNGTYTLDRNYPTYSSDNGYNCSVVPATDGGTKRDGAAITPTKVGAPGSGNKCRYVYDASANTLTITKLYNLTYNGNDKKTGTVPDAVADVLYTSTTTLSSTTLSKDGYTHTGWNTAADGSGQHFDLGATLTPSETDLASSGVNSLTLYAEWTASVTLDKNGGSNGGTASTFYKSGIIDISTTPTHATAGYTIRGYYAESGCSTLVADKDGNLADATVSGYITSGKWTASSSQTLYTKWDNTYTVSFNNASADIAGTESTTATYGSAMPTITIPTKTGYTFGGYWSTAGGSGTQYYKADGTSNTNWNVASNTTLHAKWTANTYEVAFDANGGTGSMSNQAHTYGSSLALTTNAFTHSGYYFVGWNTHADGSGTKYDGGKTVSNLTSIGGATITLYAQWVQTHTLYFILAGCGWNPPYAKAHITYDTNDLYPLTGSDTWSAMTNVSKGIYLTNVSNSGSHDYTMYKIEGVPEGAQINFSNDGSDAVGYKSWTLDRPYFVYGNQGWYGIDKYAVNPENKDTITQATNMSVAFGGTDYGIDEHGVDGQYAIVNLSANIWYTNLKFHNWMNNGWSGCTATGDASNLITSSTETGVSSEWTLNGENNFCIQTTVAGEYKFVLTGYDNKAPKVQVYFPVGVSLGALDVTRAVAGSSTTVTLTATPAKSYLSPYTYYYQKSTDGGSTWTTITTSSDNSYAYTFAAEACKFRVMLENSAGLKTVSGTQDFTTYSLKSFYVYNPYNDDSNKWRWLHLYTWDSNDGNRTYNGSWPGGYIQGVDNASPASCENDNTLEYIGNNWFKITINELANCFMLVGEETYSAHQTVTCYVSNYIEDGKYMIYTESSQNKVGAYSGKQTTDYRLVYNDGSADKYYSPIYNTNFDESTQTASMWLDPSDTDAKLRIEQGNGSGGWTTIRTYSNSASKNFGALAIGSDYQDHGHVFKMTFTMNGASSALSGVEPYDGSYYVRTDGIDGGWNVYQKADHEMQYNLQYDATLSPYDYYLCSWIGTSGKNVKFTVANDYNPELVSSFDAKYGTSTLPTASFVRFAWNSRTNTLDREHIKATGESRFLVLKETSTTKLYNLSDEATSEFTFTDNGNLVYEVNMKAKPGASATVSTPFYDSDRDLVASTELVGGSGDGTQTYRLIYDFKTNIMTNAWVPNGAVGTSNIELNSNVLLVREGQNEGAQISISTGSLTKAKKMIGVMQFDYDHMVGKMSSWNATARQYCMYYISFPWEVKVSDIYGIGTYGTEWKLQYYDGAERASKGFFRGDGTVTFWKDVPLDGTLEANVGYSLLLNRIKFNDGSSNVWENLSSGSSVYLYFPSASELDEDDVIKKGTASITLEPRPHTSGRTFEATKGHTVSHNFTDSHWNMMGIPLFESATSTDGASFVAADDESMDDQGNFPSNKGYFYEWTYSTNSLSVRAAEDYEFKSMHGYMVQFAGTVSFVGSAINPSVAARCKEEKKNYTIELQLLQNEDQVSRAYVELRDEASDEFALNEDVYMAYTSRPADLFTFAGNYDVSANVMSVDNHVVPVGVEVHNEGTYTFSMPSNFSGSVTLVDKVLNTRTNLAVADYEVTLPKGVNDQRFELEINIKNAPTAIDGVEDGSIKDGKAHKFLQNGQMFILRDGRIYDATGALIK